MKSEKNIRKIIRQLLFESNLYNILHSEKNRHSETFFFKVDEYDYRVSFDKFSKDDRYFAFGFKAKHQDSDYYDFDILTNKNVFRVMQTMADIIEKFYNN